jgi:hypothetical protein
MQFGLLWKTIKCSTIESEKSLLAQLHLHGRSCLDWCRRWSLSASLTAVPSILLKWGPAPSISSVCLPICHHFEFPMEIYDALPVDLLIMVAPSTSLFLLVIYSTHCCRKRKSERWSHIQ